MLKIIKHKNIKTLYWILILPLVFLCSAFLALFAWVFYLILMLFAKFKLNILRKSDLRPQI
jgi:hypothetical protein